MDLTTLDLSDLKKQDPNVEGNLRSLLEDAQKKGAVDSIHRLALLGRLFNKVTVEEAYQLINPDDVLQEVGEATIRKSRIGILQVLRNIFSLAPLMLTWVGLFLASSAYQQYGVLHPKDLTEPFLLLWQNSFHGLRPFGFLPVFSFAEVALVDFVCLLSLLICILLIQHVESRAQKIADTFASKLETTTDLLIQVVSTAGAGSLLQDADVDRIAEAVNRAVVRAMAQSDKVALDAKNFIAASEVRVNATVAQFDNDLNLFNADLTQLTNNVNGLTINLQSYNQYVQELADAGKLLAGSSTTLVTNTQEIATSAAQSTQASVDIGNQLSLLNSTQQSMVQEIATTQQQVVAEIDATQQQIVNQIATNQQTIAAQIEHAADSMKVVSKDTRAVAKELGQITRADLQTMTDQVTQAANQVTGIAGGLSGIEQALLRAAQTLEDAAKNYANSRINQNTVFGRGQKVQSPPVIQSQPPIPRQPVNNPQANPPRQQPQMAPAQFAQQGQVSVFPPQQGQNSPSPVPNQFPQAPGINAQQPPAASAQQSPAGWNPQPQQPQQAMNPPQQQQSWFGKVGNRLWGKKGP